MISSSANPKATVIWIRVLDDMRRISLNNVISKLGIMLLAMVLFAALSSNTVYAEGEDDDSNPYKPDETGFVDYTGDVDIYTGEPVFGDDDDDIVTGYISMKDGSVYDPSSGFFIYPLTDGTLSCSVCDDMVVTGSVSLSKTGEANVALYRDGKRQDGLPEFVDTPGNYVVLTWDNESEEQLLTFQIVSKVTGRLTQYILPNGFAVKDVTLNGELMKNSFGSVDMTKEGYYEIVYRCNATGVDYYLNVTTDHTPPNVTFEGLDENSRAKGPVTVRGLTEDDSILILLNDDQTVNLDYKSQLTESGRYHVTVMDSAGNAVTRDFLIMIYLNVKGVVFLSIIVVIIIGVLVALYISRKRLRVR